MSLRRKPRALDPTGYPCRHGCGLTLPSGPKRAAHERWFHGATWKPAPLAPPPPQSDAVLDLLRRTADPARQRTLRWYYLKLRWLERSAA